jgi:tetratricopeptide (TPR) repeat protein
MPFAMGAEDGGTSGAGRRNRCRPLFALLAVVLCPLLGACATTSGSSVNAPAGGRATATQRVATQYSEDLAAARRLIESGAYSQALPRLINITLRDQNSPQAAEAYYWTGVAHHHIGGLSDAVAAYERYLALAPEGVYATECRGALESIKTEVDAAYLSEDEFTKLIAEVEARVAREPEEMANRLLLADLYWKQGNFDAAGRLYQQMLEAQPGLVQDRVISQRMQQQTDGTWKIYTPTEAIKQDAQANPLVIYGASSFRTTELRGDLRYYTVDFYHVSGHVVNQSKTAVRNVAVDVTIQGFGNKVYDTQTVQLGAIQPGQHRTFAVRFNNFDNINNVQRYDCQLRYEQ